jgi:hypothetical protein
VKIELVHAPGCPQTATTRTRLHAAMQQLNIGAEELTERVDASYPSPSVLVNGTDIMGAPTVGPACRLDLPSTVDLLAALAAGRNK